MIKKKGCVCVLLSAALLLGACGSGNKQQDGQAGTADKQQGSQEQAGIGNSRQDSQNQTGAGGTQQNTQ